MTAPEWLTTREGALKQGLNDGVWLVTMSGRPAWRLDALPAKGQFTCAVIQTTNGRRMDGGKEYASQETAIAGGLEELREKLGW